MYPVSSLGTDPGWWRARGSLIPDLIRDHNTAAAAVAPCHCPHCSQLTRAQPSVLSSYHSGDLQLPRQLGTL